ncbi:MAG: hypothetical protein Q9219_003637 [cf. Caloplaca sp. 3 TL-2023]
MVHKGKLLQALEAHKGVNHKVERQKKLQKQAAKRKRSRAQGDSASKHDQANGIPPLMSGALQPEMDGDSGSQDEGDSFSSYEDLSDSEIELQNGAGPANSQSPYADGVSQQQMGDSDREGGDGTDSEAEDEDVPLSDIGDLSEEEKGDVIPYQRLTINNTTALTNAYNSIALPTTKLPFAEHQTIVSADPVPIPDVNDDLNRELVFHQQCLNAVKEARALLKKEGAPFSRPADYFAEMMKSDEHMGKIKQKMTEEAASKKAAADARKQRDLKKFGKQVQVAKLQEREKAKRETLDKINILKRSEFFLVVNTQVVFFQPDIDLVGTERKNEDSVGAEETDMFDVALEDASKGDKASRRMRPEGAERGQKKRQKKDSKYGFGGKKRFAKSGDAVSSSDFRAFSTQKMKGRSKGSQRLGKSRRAKKL